MKARVKFAKTGAMKFIGHLDIMRYFQKAIRRADIDIAYTEGYSPHMIMSFAAPLGVGIESSGEYFDMELKSADSSEEMKARLNKTMVEGMEILSIVQVPDGKASKAMSLVAAADYSMKFREGYEPCEDWKERFASFISQEQITIVKKTKKSEQEMDILPHIYKHQVKEDGSVVLQVAAGSAMNLKPELVMEAFFRYLNVEWDAIAVCTTRLEVYADVDGKLVSLDSLGVDFE